MSDEIALAMPAQEEFRHIAHLVAGGLGARLGLTYEHIDDLQTALDALLGGRQDGGEIQIVLEVHDHALRCTVGPFYEAQLDELDGDGSMLGLRRVLETVTDAFEVERRERSNWVVLTKKTTAAAAAAG